MEQKTGKCKWVFDDADGFYETDCGRAFVFLEGTPAENGCVFCHYCGRELDCEETQVGE